MGEIDRELASCGGCHVGVLPRFMAEIAAPGLAEVHWTDTMAERQALMRKGSIAAVALPGGIGTLDELVETLTLDHYVDTGMLEPRHRAMIAFCRTPEEILDQIEKKG